MKPLDEWIDWNSEYIVSYKSYNGYKKFPEKKIKELINESRHYTEDMSVISWLKTCVNRVYRKNRKTYFYCSEFIIHIMQESGMVKKSILPSSYKPWQLIYGDPGLYKGYSYKRPVLLKNLN